MCIRDRSVVFEVLRSDGTPVVQHTAPIMKPQWLAGIVVGFPDLVENRLLFASESFAASEGANYTFSITASIKYRTPPGWAELLVDKVIEGGTELLSKVKAFGPDASSGITSTLGGWVREISFGMTERL